MQGTPFGKYRLLSQLGRGGMGEVWRAYDTETDRVVALKVLPAHLADDATFQERFRREARAAASLHEPHVVPIHDFGEIGDRLYVDMRLIAGRNLDAVLRDGQLSPQRAVHVIEQVAAALQAVHQIGLVHRDVKPSNILLTDSDFAYLIDFGIARVVGETALTSTGSTVGTWAYMAPERFATGGADQRSDVYALTCVLYQCLTGQLPFPGPNVEQQIAGHLTVAPPRPSPIAPGVPVAFDGVVSAGMAKIPEQRTANVLALAQHARWALGQPGIPLPDTAPARPPDTSIPTASATPGHGTLTNSRTHAAPTFSAFRVPPMQGTQPPAVQNGFGAPQVAYPVPPYPGTPERPRHRGALIGAVAALLVVGAVLIAVNVGSGSSKSSNVATATTSPTPTSASSSVTSRSFDSPVSATVPPTPEPVAGWDAGNALAAEFQGLLPPTPAGIGYRGVRCYTSTETIFPGGIKIACGGGRQVIGQLELEPALVNGCRFTIESYPPGDDVMQHFYDLAPSMENAHVESWTRGAQSGSVRSGTNGGEEIVATFNSPARRNDLLYVNCIEPPMTVWWPDAPI